MSLAQLRSWFDGHQEELNAFIDDLRTQAGPAVIQVLQAVLQAVQGEQAEQASALEVHQEVALHAAQLQQLAWDKLHLGTWKDVPLAWRDLYALCCGVHASVVVSVSSGPGGPQAVRPSVGSPASGAALRDLDLGLMMGGPRFAPLLHACMGWSEAGPVGSPARDARAPVEQPDTSMAEPAQKRQRRSDAQEAVPCSGVQLPPGSMAEGREEALRGASRRVPSLHLPSLEGFLTTCMAAGPHGQPAVITGALDAWPAMTRWQDLDYLRRVAGHRTVPVEVGKDYLAEGWGTRLMTVSEFIDSHLAGPSAAPAAAATSPPAAATPPPRPPGPGAAGRGYLAQHALFDQIPALAADVSTPEYCVLGVDEEEGGGVQAVNAWIGPPGTVTPLHTDPHHNLLCQVVGFKYVRLYGPDHTDAMYPFTEGLTTNSSRVDLHAVDEERFPGFADAPFLDCVLRPGEMLYIPPGWWHFVQSLSLSFSVSWWWR